LCLWRVFHPPQYLTPSTVPDVVCPPAKEVTDPAALVPDASQFPLTNPDSAAPAERNLEVLIAYQESTSVFSPTGVTESAAISGLPPVGVTGYEGVAATSSSQGPIPAPSLLFANGKETGSHPQIPFPVRRPDSGYEIPAPSSCMILSTRERASPLCPKRIVRTDDNGFPPSLTYPFPVKKKKKFFPISPPGSTGTRNCPHRLLLPLSPLTYNNSWLSEVPEGEGGYPSHGPCSRGSR
jgi:hypothetical protein